MKKIILKQKQLSLHPCGTEFDFASNDGADYRLLQYLDLFASSSAAPVKLSDLRMLVYRHPEADQYRGYWQLFPSLLLLVGAALLLFILNLDYEYLGYAAARQLEGRPVRTCLDLPEKYWMRIPKCWDYDYPAEGKPPGLGGVSRTDV